MERSANPSRPPFYKQKTTQNHHFILPRRALCSDISPLRPRTGLRSKPLSNDIPPKTGPASTPAAPGRPPHVRSSPKPIESTRTLPRSIPARFGSTAGAIKHPLSFRPPMPTISGVVRDLSQSGKRRPSWRDVLPDLPQHLPKQRNRNFSWFRCFARSWGEVATEAPHEARPRATLTEAANHP